LGEQRNISGLLLGQGWKFSFDAVSRQAYTIATKSSDSSMTWLANTPRISAPSGATMASYPEDGLNSGLGLVNMGPASTTERYTAVIKQRNNQGANPLNRTVSSFTSAAAVGECIGIDMPGKFLNASFEGQGAMFCFQGQAGQKISAIQVQVLPGSLASDAIFFAPSGTVVNSPAVPWTQTCAAAMDECVTWKFVRTVDVTLPESGQYRLWYRSQLPTWKGTAGNYALTLSNRHVASSVSLGVSPKPVVIGQPVKLTASIEGNLPSGTVTFFDAGIGGAGRTAIGSVSVSNGKAILTTEFSTAGIHGLTAWYSGDVHNDPRESALLNVDVMTELKYQEYMASISGMIKMLLLDD
jgi:hypothetical protein